MARNLLNKTNYTILPEWLTALGKYKTEYKEEGEITENCNHNNYEKNGAGKEKFSKNTIIESIPCSAQIRFPKKPGRKSQM